MGKQINLYLNQFDIEKIQKYLSDRNFLLFEGEANTSPLKVQTDRLIKSDSEWARFIAFENVQFNYREFEKDQQKYYQIDDSAGESMLFSYYDRREEIFRIRFFYSPYYFVNHEKMYKNLEFFRHVDRFFRWLRRQFKRVPDMPTFYYNPDFPPKEWF